MPWNAKHNETLQLIEVVYTGLTTARDLQEATSKCIAMGKEKGINRFLVDSEGLELSASFVDVFELCDKKYTAEKADRLSRIAVVLPRSTEAQEVARFYETVCRNRGWMANVVSTRQEAIDWLLSRKLSNKPAASDGL